MNATLRSPAILFAIAVSLAALVAGCVDGTTPDCSDAAAQCGPDFDGAAIDGATDAPPSDAPSDGSPDAAPDAPPDAPADGPRDAPAG